MKEIKVGEYVRTKKDGICKLLQIDEDNMWCGYVDKPFWLRKDNIVKHSPNIIDLIEKDDYVNGHLVVDKYKDTDDYGKDFITIEIESDLMVHKSLLEKHIKSIVTKEQFENISYKVEG